jgi:hypothetical protein
MSLAMLLSTACAEQDKGDDSAKQAATPTAQASDVVEIAQGDSLMDQPVDFSTPEKVEETLQNILEQDGEGAYNSVKNAMKYIMFYDLSIGQDEEKMHKKLNGQTPNQIIAMTQRRQR